MVRHYVRKRTFSTPDRVLIHLSTDDLRPEEQTQEAIATATRSGRSTLTKWLDRLEVSGIVTRDRIRLPGHPLPKYGYRLTESGWMAAIEFRQRLAAEVVTVRTANLGELSVRIPEIPNLAPARLDLTGAVAAVRKGKLDLPKVAPAARKRGPVVWGSGLRRVDRFFGRTEDLRDLDGWWSSDARILLITGLAGIGKSTLVAAWVQGRRLGAPVYGLEIRHSLMPSGLLSDLGAFLSALGKPALATHLAQGAPLDSAFVSRLLERDFADGRALIVLDNIDQASPGVARLVDRLFVRGGPKLRVRLVLLGRRVPRWLNQAPGSASSFDVRQVHGLDSAASRALLRSRGLGSASSLVEEIVRKTRGHPLLLHLAASTGTGHGSAVQEYVKEEVWNSLAAKEQSILEAASIFRKAAGERLLGAVAQADPRALERLAERNLLERTIAGGYVMHDLVREFVVAQLSDSRRRGLHARAAAVLLRAADSHDRWEGVYHLLESGRIAAAAALLDSEGASLLDCVTAEEIAPLVRGIAFEEGDPGTYCVFAELLGDSLRIRGHVGPALFQYAHAQRLVLRSGQSDRVPKILRKMAFLERCRNRYSKALGYLVEAQARLVDVRNTAEMAETLREMALAEQALGEFNQATGHLNEAVDLATDLSDLAALSRTLLALGSLQARQGNPEAGLQSNLEGLRAAERSGNLTELAHAHIVVGTTLAEVGRLKESLAQYEKGKEIAQLLGNLRLTAYATLNRTAALIELGRFLEAGQLLQEAEGYFGTLEERDSLALLKTYEGQRQMGLGHWVRAKSLWEDGLASLRKYGSPADLAVALKQVGDFYIRHGDLGEGRTHVLEALEISKKVGNLKLRREAEALLDRHEGAARPRTSF